MLKKEDEVKKGDEGTNEGVDDVESKDAEEANGESISSSDSTYSSSGDG